MCHILCSLRFLSVKALEKKYNALKSPKIIQLPKINLMFFLRCFDPSIPYLCIKLQIMVAALSMDHTYALDSFLILMT